MRTKATSRMVVKLLLILLIGYNAYNINSLKVYENSAKLFDKSTETISPHLHLNYNENEGKSLITEEDTQNEKVEVLGIK